MSSNTDQIFGMLLLTPMFTTMKKGFFTGAAPLYPEKESIKIDKITDDFEGLKFEAKDSCPESQKESEMFKGMKKGFFSGSAPLYADKETPSKEEKADTFPSEFKGGVILVAMEKKPEAKPQEKPKNDAKMFTGMKTGFFNQAKKPDIKPAVVEKKEPTLGIKIGFLNQAQEAGMVKKAQASEGDKTPPPKNQKEQMFKGMKVGFFN